MRVGESVMRRLAATRIALMGSLLLVLPVVLLVLREGERFLRRWAPVWTRAREASVVRTDSPSARSMEGFLMGVERCEVGEGTDKIEDSALADRCLGPGILGSLGGVLAATMAAAPGLRTGWASSESSPASLATGLMLWCAVVMVVGRERVAVEAMRLEWGLSLDGVVMKTEEGSETDMGREADLGDTEPCCTVSKCSLFFDAEEGTATSAKEPALDGVLLYKDAFRCRGRMGEACERKTTSLSPCPICCTEALIWASCLAAFSFILTITSLSSSFNDSMINESSIASPLPVMETRSLSTVLF